MSEFDESTSTDSMEIIGIQDSKNVRISVDNLLSSITKTASALSTRVTTLEGAESSVSTATVTVTVTADDNASVTVTMTEA